MLSESQLSQLDIVSAADSTHLTHWEEYCFSEIVCMLGFLVLVPGISFD